MSDNFDVKMISITFYRWSSLAKTETDGNSKLYFILWVSLSELTKKLEKSFVLQNFNAATMI